MASSDIEPEIRDAVQHVVNRYGAPGLEDLIAYAQEELLVAQEELRKLAE
jgi:hypothetical protein